MQSPKLYQNVSSLNPSSKRFVLQFHDRRQVAINSGRNDVALKESLAKLLAYMGGTVKESKADDFPPITLLEPIQELTGVRNPFGFCD